jgi:hypothetical protein
MPIQDNLNGALLISAIDFILSFVIIGGIGAILALFPLLNRFGKQKAKDHQAMPSKRSVPKAPASAAALPASSSVSQSATTGGLHPGLSDQQLVVLLTAAAYETLGRPVRVDRFRPLNAKGWNWAAQGRHELQSHRLK